MAVRSVAVWLEDVMKALEKIRSYTEPYKELPEFLKNPVVVDAVERNFEKISEGLKNAYKQQPDLKNQQYSGNHFFSKSYQPCLL